MESWVWFGWQGSAGPWGVGQEERGPADDRGYVGESVQGNVGVGSCGAEARGAWEHQGQERTVAGWTVFDFKRTSGVCAAPF